MKKILFLAFTIILFLLSIAFKNISYLQSKDNNDYSNWNYIGNCIDISKPSIKDEQGYKTAVFRVIISDECNSYKSKNKNTDYFVIKYGASCNNKNLLKTIYIKSYDKYQNRIKDGSIKKEQKVYNQIPNGEVFYEAICGISKYDKSEVMTYEEYLYADKKKSDILSLNKNNDVIYNGKVVLTSAGVPLNEKTAYSYMELKILFTASGIKPREGCDPNDTVKNGVLGCYMDLGKD